MSRILVVDDDKMNIMMATRILNTKYSDVVAVSSGEECLKELNDGEYDLVLLDIEMPGMDGFTTLERIRALNNGDDIKVIFLSASMDSEQEERAKALKAIDFIKKPFMPNLFLEKVGGIL